MLSSGPVSAPHNHLPQDGPLISSNNFLLHQSHGKLSTNPSQGCVCVCVCVCVCILQKHIVIMVLIRIGELGHLSTLYTLEICFKVKPSKFAIS